MSELILPEPPALKLARDVLDGVLPEDQRSPFAAFNFLNTVQMIYGEKDFVQGELDSGRMAIITPFVDSELRLIAEGVQVDRRLIALLNPNIWTDQSLFDPHLVRSDTRFVYHATRRTISDLFKIL